MSSTTRCGHCGTETFVRWQSTTIQCLVPDRSNTDTIGKVHATTCAAANCGKEILEYTSAAEDSERVPVYPNQGDLTLEVVITLVIEIENYKRQANDEPPMTEAEKQEAREKPEVIDRAKQLILATAASAAGGTAANVISGLLS